jgi:hypothetical protein
VGKVLALGMDHLGDAGDLRGGLGRRAGVVPSDQHVHFTAALRGRRDSVEGRAADGGIVVFCYYQ